MAVFEKSSRRNFLSALTVALGGMAAGTIAPATEASPPPPSPALSLLATLDKNLCERSPSARRRVKLAETPKVGSVSFVRRDRDL